MEVSTLKTCELHVHTGGCLFTEDLLVLGKDFFECIDWSFFCTEYQIAFGWTPDPVALYHEALTDLQGVQRLRDVYVFGDADGGDFGRFQAKFNFAISVYRYWWHILQREAEVVQRIIDRHRAEGMDYVEYRALAPADLEDPEGFIRFHRLNAQVMQANSNADFTARYIISVPRCAPLEGYALVQRLLDENPGLISTIVGLDLCFFEEGYPPKTVRALCQQVKEDNQRVPERALEIVYHVGETYFDKSLESSVRWCHEAALLGIRRLGHAVALGLDPAIAVSRRPQAHEKESVDERLDQIAYDLAHGAKLAEYGICINREALATEAEQLRQRPLTSSINRFYDPLRLEQIRQRQNYALDCLASLGTVIESCPTSNLRIGGVPDVQEHPIHRFLRSKVNLVVGADDPGIFNQTLSQEIDWLLQHCGLEVDALLTRLGDPRRFRLGLGRPMGSASRISAQ